MELGELSIISKQGVELKEHVTSIVSIERDQDPLEQEQYLAGYDLNCNGIEVELNEPLRIPIIHPLDVHIEGDYISGAYRDSQMASGPYTIKIWLMLEESEKSIQS